MEIPAHPNLEGDQDMDQLDIRAGSCKTDLDLDPRLLLPENPTWGGGLCIKGAMGRGISLIIYQNPAQGGPDPKIPRGLYF
jgi:hypothetical protein